MVLSGSAAPLAAVDTDGSAGGGGDPAVYTAAAYVVLHCDLLCIGDSYHPKMRHFFIQEQVMRTQALQFSSIFQAPFADATGMNFIPLHAYGGTVILSFLSSSDAAEIQAFLQRRSTATASGHWKCLPPEIPQTFRRSRSSMPLKVRCSRRQELAAMRKIRRKGAVHDAAWDCR